MSTPRVTVAIPFHDEAPFLEQAIRSVLAQTFDDFELLLVDDASTDRSVEIARRFLQDPRVRLLVDGRRRHLPARLNEVVRQARGELVARMDGDDVMHPEKLAVQVAHLDREQGCDAVGTWAALIGDDDVPFGVVEAPATRPRASDVLVRPPIPHATMLARAAWLRRFPYDETLTRAEDRDLWCRTAGRSRIDAIRDVLYVIRLPVRREGFLRDYLRGQADLRRVLLRHGPALGGPLVTARLLGASVLKSAAMATLDRLGRADTLVYRRGRQLTAAEARRVEEALSSSRVHPRVTR